MYKRYAFYTFSFLSAVQRTLIYQGCIKSCIKEKYTLERTLTATRVLFGGVFRKECLCKLALYMIYIVISLNIIVKMELKG